MHRFSTISVFLLLGTASASAQNLTSSAAYKAYMDSLSREYSAVIAEWNATIPPHNINAMRLEEEAEEHPELRDSLLAIAAEERQIAKDLMASVQLRRNQIQEKQLATMERYALVFEEAFMYFNWREQYTKDSLSVLLNKSSPAIKHSRTGKALKKYIKHRQLGEGDKFKTFRCYDRNGKRFDWSQCKGRKVFLIHDGLWCMTHGTDNTALRKYLHDITEVAPECLPLIFVDCDTTEELQKSIETYGLQEFLVVSEFQKDLGTLNWLYNDSTTPTCHYIDGDGTILYVSEGIDDKILRHKFLGIE